MSRAMTKGARAALLEKLNETAAQLAAEARRLAEQRAWDEQRQQAQREAEAKARAAEAERSAAARDGADKRRRGYTAMAVPYEVGHPLRAAWMGGWRSAKAPVTYGTNGQPTMPLPAQRKVPARRRAA